MITRQGAGCKKTVLVVPKDKLPLPDRTSPLFQPSERAAPSRTLIGDARFGSLGFSRASSLSAGSQYPVFGGQVGAPFNGTAGHDGHFSDGNASAGSPTCVLTAPSLRSASSSPTTLSRASSEMDKGDYSEVKELITATHSNAGTSRLDAVFYGVFPKDEMRKVDGAAKKPGAETANTGRHGIRGGYNIQRSEKDPSSWAIVHEGGHAHHFADGAAADNNIAFVTKNALALRDAQAKESQTAPFKSIQSSSTEKAAAEESKSKKPAAGTGAPTARATAQTTTTGSAAAHYGPSNNIFSFNSGHAVKAATEAEPYDYERDNSTASFDFNRAIAHRPPATGVGPLAKPTPSKWDDAEKWVSGGEAPAPKPRPKINNSNGLLLAPQPVALAGQPAGATASWKVGDGLGPNDGTEVVLNPGTATAGEDSVDGNGASPENGNKYSADRTKKALDSSTKGGLPRFAFMPAGKPLPLPPPAATPVDRYPLEDVYGRDAGDAKESSLYSDAADDTFPKPALRTAKPTSESPNENHDHLARSTNEAVGEASPPATAAYDEPAAVANVRTVCMVDMGTEMTPIASVEPSRTATPLRSTTPNLRSPANSRPSTPLRRTALNSTPTNSSEYCHSGGTKGGGTKTGDSGGEHQYGSKAALSGKELQAKTRQEILALGTQLGKANIAAWATKEEEEADAAQALKASMQMEEVRKHLLATRAAAWEEAEQAKYTARYKREEAKIQAWENHEKAKAEAEMRRIEVKVERMRSHATEKLMNKLAAARRHAEDLRAKAEALRGEQASKTASRAEHIRRTGTIPTSLLGHLCG